MQSVDFIIVGQGIAGSVLSLKLIENGYSVKVIDDPSLSSSSKVAVGVWNPIVFKSLTKSWMIDELLPEMLKFFKRAEILFKKDLITERHIVKLFSEQQEVDLWKQKAKGELKEYLDSNIYRESEYNGVKIPLLGYSKVLRAGNLDLKLFLDEVRKFLEEKNALLQEKFNHTELKISETISYKDLTAKNIIFAEGYLIRNNPLFSYVPLKPSKGEVLTIRTEHLDTGIDVITKNAFLLQVKKDTYRLGATYNWEDLTEDKTEKALSELGAKMKKFSDADYSVLKHDVGVRPSVIDRRPVLGNHPSHKNVYVFNGLGTKCVMLAPYFAQKLIDSVKTGEMLPSEVNVSRFNHFFVN